MNVFEIDIWKQVKHNDKFSHTVTRMELVHARNEAEAKGKITLENSREYHSGNLDITVSGEFIYSVRKTGTVRKQLFYVYSDGRTPRPVAHK